MHQGSTIYSFNRSAYEQNKDCICFGKQNPEQNFFLRRNKSYQLKLELSEQAHIAKQKLKSVFNNKNGSTNKRSLKNDKIVLGTNNLPKNGINLTKVQSSNYPIASSPISKQNKNIHLLQQYRESYPSTFSAVPKITFKQNEPFKEAKVTKALSWNHFRPIQQNQFYSPIKQNKNQYIEASNCQKPQINFTHQTNITVNIGADTKKEAKIKRLKQPISIKKEMQIAKIPSTAKFSNKFDDKQSAVIKGQLSTTNDYKDCVKPKLQQSTIKMKAKGESLAEKQIKLALSKQKRRQSTKHGQNIKNKKERGKSLKKMDDALQCKSMNDQDQQRDDDDNVSIVLDRLNQYSSYVEPICEENTSASKLPSHNSTTFKSMLRNFSSKKVKEGQFMNQQ